MNSYLNIESLYQNFPQGFTVPKLLIDFCDWLKSHPEQTLGSFHITSERFNDYYIEEGSDLQPYFANFLRDSTGGTIGYWLYDGLHTKSPPIVLFGSEGELKILAEDLMDFLRQFLKQGEVATIRESFDPEPTDDERVEFASWLGERPFECKPLSLIAHPDIGQWIENWVKPRRDRFESDPIHVELTNRLRKYLQPNAEAWDRECFDVLLVGSHFQMWHRSYGPKDMPRSDYQELEPLFRALREQRVKQMPERGAWFYAWVCIYPTLPASLACEFMKHPKIGEVIPELSDSDLRLDLLKYPRTAYWMPAWLTQRLKKSD